jgi:hypothetical protein
MRFRLPLSVAGFQLPVASFDIALGLGPELATDDWQLGTGNWEP